MLNRLVEPAHVWVLVLAFGTAAYAADPNQFSEAERRLFSDNHLRNVGESAILEYAFRKRGSLEANVDERARVTVGEGDRKGPRTARVEFLSGARTFELPTLEHAEGNPLILFFLERDVREMNRLTRGSSDYYRKRIRMAFAEAAEVRTAEVPVAGHRVAATEIRIAPFRDDPARARYEKFAEKIYVLVLSNDVPGQVIELRSELFGPAVGGGPAEMVISESLRFVGKR
jgi:hypothetical protein